MKKFLSVIAFAICIMSVNFCFANPYDDNSNYIRVRYAPNSFAYINLNSVKVQEYNPPHYQIAAHYVVVVEGRGGESNVQEYDITKRYNWDTKETFHLNENGNWQKDDIKGNLAPHARSRAFCDAIFRAAYNMDFYGY